MKEMVKYFYVPQKNIMVWTFMGFVGFFQLQISDERNGTLY